MTNINNKTKTKKEKETTATLRITLCSFYVALICVCSVLSVPQPFSAISFTMGLFAIIFFPALSLDGVKAVIIFILMGLLGIPVFSNFKATDALFGATGGYIIGYIPAAIIAFFTSHLAFIPPKSATIKTAKLLGEKNEDNDKITPSRKSKLQNNIKKSIILTIGFLFAVTVCYTFGTAWFVISKDVNIMTALTACVFPFIIFDCAKVALAVILTIRLRPIAQATIKKNR